MQSSGTVPDHVLTAAYMYSKDGETFGGRPFSAYATSLTWAETYSASAVAASGIKTIYYTNPNRTEPGMPLYTGIEGTFAHTCSGARITEPGTSFDLMNPSSQKLVSMYKSLVDAELSSQHFDAIMDDEPFDWSYLSAMPCNYNSNVWLNAYIAEMKALSRPVIYNGLENLGPHYSVSPSIQLNPGAIGGMAEGCYSWDHDPPYPFGPYWQEMENAEIEMAQQNKLFICYGRDLTSASEAAPVRIYSYASFLLTYAPSTSIVWEYFGTSSGYSVEPESELVALSPLVAAPTQISGLLTSTGVYGRQYGACYIAGRSVGPCAAVVNSDNAHSYAFPYAGYHHTLQLSGGGILDGGSVSTSGPPPPSILSPTSAVIAFQ
jgi:hypothetical protein